MTAKGISVVSGTTHIHKLLNDGTVSFSGSVQITGTLLPQGDAVRTIGSEQNRWADVFAQQTTVGAVFETGLTTKGIGDYPTGTVVIWESGKVVPCSIIEDNRVVGATFQGKDQPIILGAEYVLVTGKVKEGDWIVTSNKFGHGCAAQTKTKWGFKRDLFGKVLGQALENADGDSNLIKCFIKKL
jgi:hypothetical protein